MPALDPVRFAREWTVIEELALHRGLATRDRDPDPVAATSTSTIGSSWRDPIGSRRDAVCASIGVSSETGPATPCSSGSTPIAQDAHGSHRYTPEEFGLDADRLRARFASTPGGSWPHDLG